MNPHEIETTLTVLAIAFLLAVIYATRSRSRRCKIVPLSDAQRIFQWERKMDAEIGLKSEAFLELGARGVDAKRRLMAECRNRQRKSILKVAPAEPNVTAMVRDGTAPPVLKAIKLVELKTFAKPAPVELDIPVVVRKPKLSFAR